MRTSITARDLRLVRDDHVERHQVEKPRDVGRRAGEGRGPRRQAVLAQLVPAAAGLRRVVCVRPADPPGQHAQREARATIPLAISAMPLVRSVPELMSTP